ncbi:MAG: hypothetical protein COT17_04850 [Elusimicrobia bacterium CG08_land_8_20_14_0_20_51_18]|nr:MAG: hypothetical protein COT17_04850 [Elusimicrobia bacterium CG08_land_8_20_14_0_20_51_18]
MKKTIPLLISFLFAGSAVSAENSALEQLGLESAALEMSFPDPLPETASKGDAFNYVTKWDPDAPFMSCQKPAEAVFNGGSVSVKNMRWGGIPEDKKSYVWSRVSINPEMLEKVYYGYKTSGVGHSFFVFVFKKGGLTNEQGETAPAFTAGAEGWSREPHGYNVMHASAGKYPLIWNLTTFSNYADYTVTARKSRLFLAEINITRGQAGALLIKTLERINQTNAGKELYETFGNNCTTNPVDLLNSVLEASRRIDRSSFLGLANPDFTFPKFAVKKYSETGVISAAPLKVDEANFETFDISSL